MFPQTAEALPGDRVFKDFEGRSYAVQGLIGNFNKRGRLIVMFCAPKLHEL